MTVKSLKIARVATVPIFVVAHLRKQLQYLTEAGADVHVITSDGEHSNEVRDIKDITFSIVNIPRKIDLINDFIGLIALFLIFRRKQFDIIHSTTPKAGLLCALAGKLAGNKVRLHTFTGQPWATMNGFKSLLLKNCDKLIGFLNTKCYADSNSQMEFLIANGIVSKRKISVLGEGSVAGIDLKRFRRDRYSDEEISEFKSSIGLPLGSKVILFVGRITADKGIKELVGAFNTLCATYADTYLVLVGPLEEDGRLALSAINPLTSQRVKFLGFSNEPEKYMRMADILCLPSYREGFGTVVIEAAAMGTPTVGTSIYGLTDAVVHEKSGLLVPVRDEEALASALSLLLDDDALRLKMATYAQNRAEEKFDTAVVSKCLVDEYEALSRK